MRAAAPVLLAALALSACGSSGSIATTTQSAARRSAGVGKSARHGAARTTANAGLRAFAIFRRPAAAHDEIPTDQAVGGVRPGLSRLAYAGPLGMLFVYSHAGALCVSFETRISLSSGAGSGRCDSLATARTAGVALTVTATSDHVDRLAMIVPDGVQTVTVTRATGGPVSLPVRGNAVVYGTPGLHGWSFRTSAGGTQSGALATAAAHPAP